MVARQTNRERRTTNDQRPTAIYFAVTFRVNVAVFVRPPPVAVTVTGVVPAFAVLPRVRVRVLVPLPGAATVVALNAFVIPVGSGDNEKVTAELNPPPTTLVSVRPTFPLGRTDTTAGLTLKVNPQTVTFKERVRVMPPPVAAKVSGYVPGASVAAEVKVRVLLPTPGEAMLGGEKLAVSPDGSPLTDRLTALPKPPAVDVVKVICPLFPARKAVELAEVLN